ncbi:MAG TPA: hypothetical protein VFE42_24295 [Chloroflexota bacterium]|nr:hypothetical protein [Chloroflexota bacterium]
MSWPPSDLPDARVLPAEIGRDVAPGVARVRPAAFPSLNPGASAIMGPSALRAYRPDTADSAGRDDTTRAGSGVTASLDARISPRGRATRRAVPAGMTANPASEPAPPASAIEQQLAPLRDLSRELVQRGMAASLVSELLAEILSEYGSQVLASDRNARLALVEQLMLRIPDHPLLPDGGQLTGTQLVLGPAGSGKSLLIAHLALIAAQGGQRDVILVNTDGTRIGAAAQMNALGKVFGYDVEHVYTPHEFRSLCTGCAAGSLLLVETVPWSPRADVQSAWTTVQGQLSSASAIVCVPAPAQADDLADLLSATHRAFGKVLAVLTQVSETRNMLPALGVLAQRRQAVGMVVPGPDLSDVPPPPALADVAREALGLTPLRAQKGHNPW